VVSERHDSTNAWQASGLVTLTTDFGVRDTFVGVMKGVLHGIAPGVRAIDLTHEVPAQDVRSAAFHVRHAWRWFPEGTVHVVVVDPGVGSARRILLARQAGHAFLAPDNGLLSGVLGPEAGARARVSVSRDHVVGGRAEVVVVLGHRVAMPLFGGWTVHLEGRATMRVER
jgi:S-adenosylmethionine hydrolase